LSGQTGKHPAVSAVGRPHLSLSDSLGVKVDGDASRVAVEAVRRGRMSVAGLGSTVEITRVGCGAPGDAKGPILGLLDVLADDGGQQKGCFGDLGTELASFQLL
jgi:hypothetical protein